jgi:hypothetical protein
MGMYLMGVYYRRVPISVYLIGLHLTVVHLIGLHLTVVHLIGLHLIGVHPGWIRGANSSASSGLGEFACGVSSHTKC